MERGHAIKSMGRLPRNLPVNEEEAKAAGPWQPPPIPGSDPFVPGRMILGSEQRRFWAVVGHLLEGGADHLHWQVEREVIDHHANLRWDRKEVLELSDAGVAIPC
jgi:hypothetical protein